MHVLEKAGGNFNFSYQQLFEWNLNLA